MSGKARLLALAALLPACWDEELPEQELSGSLVVPASLAPDRGDIGIVYVGLFENFDPHQLGYPYPSTGPRVGDNPIGDALPYGGTSIGAYAYGCFRALACQLVTGRFETLDELIAARPVEDEAGAPVDAEGMFDQCTWYYGWNSLAEFTFVGEDKLDFDKNDDGDWQADFTMWRTRVPDGARIWAFADNDFTSCSPQAGAINRRRGDDGNFFHEGTNFGDVLNFPDKYISLGDWVSSEPDTAESGRSDGYSVTLDYAR